jgi:hypothetical protein
MKKIVKTGIGLLCGGLLMTAQAGKEINRPLAVNGETLQRYYQKIFRENFSRYREAVDAASTREDALKLVAAARERVKRAYDAFPAEKCELNARTLETIDFPEFTLEKVLFESRRNFTVTANFYLPKKGNGKFPAVLFLSGHAQRAKAHASYAKVSTMLARKGCAVLAIDPIHQGERMQFFGKNAPDLCSGHNILNRQLLAVGESISDWRAWDGIRGIDYLLSRPEVDPARIGVNGNSGGGTLTAMVAANDDRVAAAAPACYITTFLNNVENELPVDGEQAPRCFLANGGEMADLLLAQAPRPVRILSQTADFFDVRGANETYAMLKKLYTLLGAPENISLVCGPDDHGYGPELRQGAYEFFDKVFHLNSDKEMQEGAPPTYNQLCCLPEGGVSKLPGEKLLRDLIGEKMAALKKARTARPKSREEMQKALTKLLKITLPEKAPHYRVLRPVSPKPKGPAPLMRFALETEPELFVTLFAAGNGRHFGLPAVMSEKVSLYLPHLSCRDEMGTLPKEPACGRFGLDYRGIGESEPSGCDQWNHDFTHEYNYDYHFASLGVMLGQPMIGRRVYDVLSAMKLLRENGAKEITLRATGFGIYPAIFAAVLSPEPVKLVLDDRLVTYEEAGRAVISPIPQSFIPPGILRVADLDELLKFADAP